MGGAGSVYRVFPNERMASHTTFCIGGPVRRLVEVAPTAEDVAAVWEAFDGEDIAVVGGGSNLLVADDGYPGTVVMLAEGPALRLRPDGTVTVSASDSWEDLVTACAKAGLSGIERTAGIPGTVGGAIVQNAGAYGQFVKDVLRSVTCFDRTTRDVVILTKDGCELAYRTSIFRAKPQRYVILDARFTLTPATRVAVEEIELIAILVKVLGEPAAPTFAIVPVMRAVRCLRFLRDNISAFHCRSAGSFFLNYELAPDDPMRSKIEDIFGQQIAALEAAGETFIRNWAAYNTNLSYLYAGSLIASGVRPDGVGGFLPGSEHGRLRLGVASSNTIVNRRNASASEVVALAKSMRDSVEDTYGITLRPEVLLLGPPGFETF